MVALLIDLAARAVGETRHVQQGGCQRIQLRLTEIGSAMGGRKLGSPQNFDP